jgi:Zn-dependent protease with chaperone function
MNFFEHEANARRNTGRLLLYFFAAVLLTVLAVNAGMYVLGRFAGVTAQGNWLWHAWSPQAIAGSLLIIVGGSLLEYLQLRGGGQALAEMVGARRIDFASNDKHERQFINVVAEMSIASGVTPPVLYVMDDEAGINAFVAGLSLHETIMVVTAGALEAFSRDELQAVVGHEFSHILNGDMRLNVRLIALLAGILAIGQMGSFLLRISFPGRSSYGDSNRADNDRNGGVFYFVLLGVFLWAVGALGLFFGRLIKAAISRQRELLADASSVQFTRNPDGLAGALLKIRDQDGESWLKNIRAESMSHMCFGETLHYSALFATHPPLDERIRRLGSQYLIIDRARKRVLQQQSETAADVASANGLSPLAEAVTLAAPPVVRDLPPIAYVSPATSSAVAPVAQMTARVTVATVATTSVGAFTAFSSGQGTAASAVASVGEVNPQQLASAQEVYRRLPAGVLHALTSSDGAQALLYALIARQNQAPSESQQAFMVQQAPALSAQMNTLYRALEGLDFCFALPLTELALPHLQLLETPVQREFLARLQAFALLDRQLSVFEFALLMLLRKKLEISPKPRAIKLTQAAPMIAVMVAALLRAGGMEGEKLERTYQRLLRTVLPSSASPTAMPGPEFTRLSQLAMSLQIIAGLALVEKKTVLELAATAVLADGEIKLTEYELLRVVAAILDCPMPLLNL